MTKADNEFGMVVDALKNNPMIVDGKLVNNILWVIQKHSGGSFISAFEITRVHDEYKYRSYSEGSNPQWVHCPKEFLTKVKVVTCKEWREKVLGHSTRKRSM